MAAELIGTTIGVGLSRTTTSSSASSGKGAKDGLNGSRTNSTTERSWRREIGLRTKWVIADKEKFTNLLKDLKDFNDGLENLFPPSQLASLQRAWTHQLLETASTGIYPK